MSQKFHHKYVQSKLGKSIFHFIDQISYLITIDFPFNQLYFHYYLLLWFTLIWLVILNSIYWLCFIIIFYIYDPKIHFVHVIPFI